MAIIMASAAVALDDIQDLGRVSEELLKAMSIAPGQFVPIDGVQHVSQKQL
jgi:hypothetical protein